ncbi:MAG: hypothetical protein NTY55_10665, partial [Flavobacteriia bacterium]|nr:hypothetical protein [Flavobacteriia bacterium]
MKNFTSFLFNTLSSKTTAFKNSMLLVVGLLLFSGGATWASKALSFSGKASASGSFLYSISSTGVLGSANNAVGIATHNSLAPVDNTVSSASPNGSVCKDAALSPITHTTTGATGIGAATGLPAGVTAVWASNTITISGTPTASGTFGYNIPLTGGSGTVSATGTITVHALPATPTVTALSATTFCDGGSVSLRSTVGSGYLWSNGLSGRTAVFTTSGSYSVTHTDGNFCTSLSSNAIVVTVNPLPTASISGTTAVCNNASSPNVTFTGAAGTAPYTFTYKIKGGSNLTVSTTGENVSVTVAAPTGTSGSFAYTLVSVVDANSCSQLQSGTSTITVNPLPTASISGTTAVCIGGSSPNVTFTGAAGTAPYTFTYKINGGSNLTVSTTGENVSVTVAAPTGTSGSFAYTLVSVVDASSTTCSQLQSGTATITVNPLPTATISAQDGDPLTFCSGESVVLVASEGTSYSWSNGSSIVGTASTYTATTSGTYRVTVTNEFGCSVQSAPTTVTVVSQPATPTISAGGITTFCAGGNVVLTASGTVGSVFKWSNGSSIVATAPTYTANTSASYTASALISSGGTVCSSSPSSAIVVTVISVNSVTAASSTPTLCINSVLTNITHTTVGATGISNSGVSGGNGLPAGVSATWASNTITISGTPSASGTFSYSIPLTGGCGAIYATGTITVSINTAAAASTTPTLCISTALTNITIATTGATGIGTASGLPAGLTAAWASNTITISGTPTASGTFNYTIPLSG